MICSDIFRFTRLAEAAISPTGNAVAFARRIPNAELDRYDWELLVCSVDDGTAGAGGTAALGAGLRKPAWAPGGRRLAALDCSGSGAPSIVVVPASGGTRQHLVGGIPEVSGLTWSPDGREIGFIALSARDDEDSGTPPAAARSPRPTASSAESRSPEAAARAPRDRPIVVENLSAKVDGLGLAGLLARQLCAVDCETGAVRQLTPPDLWVDDFCYSSSGLIAFCGSGPYGAGMPRQPGAIRPSALWLMDADGGNPRRLAPPEVSARCPVFVTDDQVAFVGLPGLRAEQPGLFAVSAAGGQVRRLAAEFDRGLVVSAANFLGSRPVAGTDGELLFCARDGGCIQLYQTSLREPAAVRKVAGSASESVGAVTASQLGDRVSCLSATADGRQRVVLLELDSGGQTALAETVLAERVLAETVLAETGPPEEPVPAAPVEFTARDGTTLNGWLIRQPTADRTPLLVDVHGGSFSGAWSPLVQPSRLYQQELAARGWTVLLLNARGSDGYGSDFARAVVGKWGEGDGPDFHDAIDALIADGLVDPARVAITGYSYGGFMSNWLTATSDRFSAAVAGGSICDFVSLFGTSDMGWSMSEFDIQVRPDRDPLAALRRSPIGQGRPVRTPTLLLHGEADLRCPISQAEEWLAVLLSMGCEAALVRYPGASHGFLTSDRPSFAADYGNRLVDWVTRHTQPDSRAARPGAPGAPEEEP
jgi:dipeptidyl aminopeptidase/acylaminoacyl peptidase